MHMHSARAAHVHYAPHHEMACTIELRSLNSISVPNLVSIAQNFLEPEDPSRIKFSGPGARSCTPHKRQPQKHTRWGSIHVTCKFGISGDHRLACRGGKRTTGAKHLHVHCTCTLHHQPISYGAKQALPRCTHVPSLVSLAQSFLKPEDPMSKKFSSPGACSLHPTGTATTKAHRLG